MMRQYFQIKKKYPDCLIMFRLGDFYEFFFDDAKIVSRILGITLTSRSKHQGKKIPMAGIPHHSVKNYLKRLVDHNYKIAWCEQLTEPDGRGIVQRDVVRIITPGNINSFLEIEEANRYIFTFVLGRREVGYAFADISTGEFFTQQKKTSDPEKFLFELIRTLPVREIIVRKGAKFEFLRDFLKDQALSISEFEASSLEFSSPEEYLRKHFKIASLRSFSLQGKDLAISASAFLLDYLIYTEKTDLSQITRINLHKIDEYLRIDHSTFVNLDIFSDSVRGRSDLFSLFNECCTPMGKRLLHSWFLFPLSNLEKINSRLEAVQELKENPSLLADLRDLLRQCFDINRIISRLVNKTFVIDDLIKLKKSIYVSLLIADKARDLRSRLITENLGSIDKSLKNIADLIDRIIIDDPTSSLQQGFVKKGVDEKLDEIKNLLFSSQEYLAKLEAEERERTGIPSLKIRFNKVFGFYIEVSKSYKDKVPQDYIRRQTLVNAERFITPKLKEYEEKILNAQQLIDEIQDRILADLRKKILAEINLLQRFALDLAHIDCLANFAHLALEYDYKKPEFGKSHQFLIREGRHPIVERMIDSPFSPNNLQMDKKNCQIMIITGPNMAGKSVYIRQVALIAYLAHIGSFVPADKVQLPLLDQIFVRSGAGDIISEGISTFMLEMIETANILNNATDKSLVVLDEIGRGTSTYDGISIAWAIAEYLAKKPGKQPFTLFATHYHELQNLERYHKVIKNFQMAIKKRAGKPVFIYKVIPGASSHSYGIYAAEMAGLPAEVVENARKILKTLEGKTKGLQVKHILIQQAPLFQEEKKDSEIIKRLKEIDPDKLTPLRALEIIYELREKV